MTHGVDNVDAAALPVPVVPSCDNRLLRLLPLVRCNPLSRLLTEELLSRPLSAGLLNKLLTDGLANKLLTMGLLNSVLTVGLLTRVARLALLRMLLTLLLLTRLATKSEFSSPLNDDRPRNEPPPKWPHEPPWPHPAAAVPTPEAFSWLSTLVTSPPVTCRLLNRLLTDLLLNNPARLLPLSRLLIEGLANRLDTTGLLNRLPTVGLLSRLVKLPLLSTLVSTPELDTFETSACRPPKDPQPPEKCRP
ncbi:hypothetical protein IWGMT90018_50410 [Mycobacterium kiyosense]|nr:hypothetical protein IWGMT90018_50410 [Mycobacterium kiyosense]